MRVSAPRSRLTKFPVVEYLRAFLGGLSLSAAEIWDLSSTKCFRAYSGLLTGFIPVASILLFFISSMPPLL